MMMLGLWLVVLLDEVVVVVVVAVDGVGTVLFAVVVAGAVVVVTGGHPSLLGPRAGETPSGQHPHGEKHVARESSGYRVQYTKIDMI
jgi:hypothetical protein